MSEELKDYQVVDVLRGGAFYKVKHKVTNNIFAWKAYDCTAYSDEQTQNIVNEVKTISKVISGNLLRYYETILHNASKTLYLVLEYKCWRSVQQLVDTCAATDKYFGENFIWHLLLDLARACKLVDTFKFTIIRKCITPSSIYIDEGGEVRVDCFQLEPLSNVPADLMRQVGEVIRTLCYPRRTCDGKITVFPYSDDLQDIVSFVSDERNSGLRPEVVIYHPTILLNVEGTCRPRNLSEILVSNEDLVQKSNLNKCDSEKAVELCKTIKPPPSPHFMRQESPIYSNVSPKQKANNDVENDKLTRFSLSPNLAALALELPGYVPRCRKPYSEFKDTFTSAQKVSEETLSHQWMSRLQALRDREESLNRRERDLIVKEVTTSPISEFVCHDDSDVGERGSNGITLPAVIASAEKRSRKPHRRRRRSGSVRARSRRRSYSYEDLDSSLSADTGDGSIIVTATKFTLDNMPRRTIFPDLTSKKVHFTPSNPFLGSDESVTLTFYDLEQLETEDNQSTQNASNVKDIAKFKYLDVASVREKRAAKQWSHSSPAKQAKVYSDVSSECSLRKTPSKSSLVSHSSMRPGMSAVSRGCGADRTRASLKQYPQTPTAPTDSKKSKIRKSLLNFKTPFKFKSSTKV